MLIGRVDLFTRSSIAGWVADKDDPNQVVEIAVYVDGVERGQYRADRPRPDLQTLKIYGEGNHGFKIDIAPALSTDEDHELIVRPITGSRPIERGHFRIAKNSADDKVKFMTGSERRTPPLITADTPRYVFHIGPHKTGSTYLQLAFSESRKELLKRGVLYPDASSGWIEPNGYSHTEFFRSLSVLETVKLAANFDVLNRSDWKTILLSSEDLIGISPEGLRYLKSLIAGRPVDIVFYCRRWSELLPSAWQETVKQGKTHTLGEFLAAQLADPLGSSVINFDIVLGKYADVFGIDSIKIVSYNDIVDNKGDLYDHFVRSILMLDEVPFVTRAASNRSLDPVDVETVRLLNEIATMRSESAGIDLFHRYWRNRSDANVSSLHTIMAECLATIRFNDAAPGLRTVHDLTFTKYSNCMVDPKSGHVLFPLLGRELPFVRTNYLLAEGLVGSAMKAYENICSKKLPGAT